MHYDVTIRMTTRNSDEFLEKMLRKVIQFDLDLDCGHSIGQSPAWAITHLCGHSLGWAVTPLGGHSHGWSCPWAVTPLELPPVTVKHKFFESNVRKRVVQLYLEKHMYADRFLLIVGQGEAGIGKRPPRTILMYQISFII